MFQTQHGVFSPSATNTMNPSSLLNDGAVYGIAGLLGAAPDKLVVLVDNDESIISTVGGKVIIATTTQGTMVIPAKNILISDTPNPDVFFVCCESARAGVWKLRCKDLECPEKVLEMAVSGMQWMAGDLVPRDFNYSRIFSQDCELTCAQKIALIVDDINQDTQGMFIASVENDEYLVLTGRDTNVVASLTGASGFHEPEQTTSPKLDFGKGSFLKKLAGVDQQGVLVDDTCYSILVFTLEERIVNANHGTFSSSMGGSNNNSYNLVRSTVWIAVAGNDATVKTALKTAFDTAFGLVIVASTTCGEKQDVPVVFCIQRTDAGGAEELDAIETDYSGGTAWELYLHDDESGISYYNVTYADGTAAPAAAVEGDIVSPSPCGSDETGV